MTLWMLALLATLTLTGCATVDTVRIDAAGNASLNGKQLPTATLSESFTRDAVVIFAESSTPMTAVTAVMDEAAEAQITNVSLKTKK